MEDIKVQVFSVNGHSSAVSKAIFNSDGDLYATSGADGHIRLWNTENNKYLGHYGPIDHNGNMVDSNTAAITNICFSSDSRYLACVRSAEYASIFETLTGRQVSFIKVSDSFGMTSIVFSLDSQTLYIGSRSLTKNRPTKVMAFDISTISEPKIRFEHKTESSVNALCLSPLNDALLAGLEDGTIHVLTSMDGSKTQEISLQSGAIRDIKLYKNSLYIVSCEEKRIHFLSCKSLEVVRSYTTNFAVMSASLHPTVCELLAYGGGMESSAVTTTKQEEDTFKVFFTDIAQGIKLGALQHHIGRIHSLEFSPDGRRILTSSQDGKACIFKFDDSILQYDYCGFDKL